MPPFPQAPSPALFISDLTGGLSPLCPSPHWLLTPISAHEASCPQGRSTECLLLECVLSEKPGMEAKARKSQLMAKGLQLCQALSSGVLKYPQSSDLFKGPLAPDTASVSLSSSSTVSLPRDNELAQKGWPDSAPPHCHQIKFKQKARILAVRQYRHLTFTGPLTPSTCFQNRHISHSLVTSHPTLSTTGRVLGL